MSKSVNVLVAAAAGFVAGILMAPKSGVETREELKDRARDAKDRLDVKSDEAKRIARDATDTIKDGAQRVEREARGLASSARQSAKTVAGEATGLRDEAKERSGRAIRETKRTAESQDDQSDTLRRP